MLKDTWKDLVDSTTGYDGDDASAEPINRIAHAVIKLEENGGGSSSIVLDSEMSDTSENAVQNKVIKKYVDGITGDIETALDNIIAIQNSLIGGDSV